MGGGLEKGYILACYRGIKDEYLAKWQSTREKKFWSQVRIPKAIFCFRRMFLLLETLLI